MEELWSKAQTKEMIIRRSGTKFNSAQDMDLAMQDAELRLQSGGGLLGKGGLSFSGILGNDKEENSSVSTVSMSVNAYLWRGALETINFMPLFRRWLALEFSGDFPEAFSAFILALPSIESIAKQSPPIPVMCGSATHKTALIANAASTALPPLFKISIPTFDAT